MKKYNNLKFSEKTFNAEGSLWMYNEMSFNTKTFNA